MLSSFVSSQGGHIRMLLIITDFNVITSNLLGVDLDWGRRGPTEIDYLLNYTYISKSIICQSSSGNHHQKHNVFNIVFFVDKIQFTCVSEIFQICK